uniref:Uncharacterized protein n=1 Tax=Cucumis melo TaxID=3656 RepID=A0A9I9E751_CUCME
MGCVVSLASTVQSHTALCRCWPCRNCGLRKCQEPLKWLACGLRHCDQEAPCDNRPCNKEGCHATKVPCDQGSALRPKAMLTKVAKDISRSTCSLNHLLYLREGINLVVIIINLHNMSKETHVECLGEVSTWSHEVTFGVRYDITCKVPKFFRVGGVSGVRGEKKGVNQGALKDYYIRATLDDWCSQSTCAN